jgi:hypothetical protein
MIDRQTRIAAMRARISDLRSALETMLDDASAAGRRELSTAESDLFDAFEAEILELGAEIDLQRVLIDVDRQHAATMREHPPLTGRLHD